MPYRTEPNRSVLYSSVPYRFPRVDRTSYRTFLTVFRDFFLKARTLPRFKCYFKANFSFKGEPYRTKTRTVFRDCNIKNLNLMEFIRKARTVPRLYEKSLKTDIYAVRFALITVFSFKK
jgi:hypothetical protein